MMFYLQQSADWTWPADPRDILAEDETYGRCLTARLCPKYAGVDSHRLYRRNSSFSLFPSLMRQLAQLLRGNGSVERTEKTRFLGHSTHLPYRLGKRQYQLPELYPEMIQLACQWLVWYPVSTIYNDKKVQRECSSLAFWHG